MRKSLIEFTMEMHEQIDKFHDMWKSNHIKEMHNYPMKMDGSEWHEQWLAFEENNYEEYE